MFLKIGDLFFKDSFSMESQLMLFKFIIFEKCIYYMEHDEQRKKIAKRGYEYCKKNYSLDLMIGKMLDIIEKI